MVAQCQKCGKTYKPKRRGGKFCSVSCRVMQHQRIKRGEVWESLVAGDERYLAAKLVAVGQSATTTLAQVKGLSLEAELAELRKLVQGWAGVANNTIIERVQYAEQQERDAQIARARRLLVPTSVSNTRK